MVLQKLRCTKILTLQIDGNSKLCQVIRNNKDNKLTFDDYVSELRNKASMRPNAIKKPIKKFFQKKKKEKELEVISKSFIYQISIIILLAF